jgi:hypothetical protein
MRHEDDDEDARRDAIDERRARHASRCVCNPKGDWPGTCPGPSACPYSGRRADDEPDDDGAED